MQPVLEGRHQTEVAPAAPQAPEQVGVLGGAAGQEPAVGGDDVGRQEVVDDEAARAHEPAETATQREAGNARRRDLPSRRGQAEGLRLVVEIAPGHPGLGPHGATGRIDPDALHEREIEHQPAVAHGVAGDVVTAPADGDEQVVGAREPHGLEHVAGAGAARDQSRLAVDRTVPNAPGGVVARIAGLQERPSQSAA